MFIQKIKFSSRTSLTNYKRKRQMTPKTNGTIQQRETNIMLLKHTFEDDKTA